MINEARRLVVELLTQAAKNEPQITADLQNITREISVEIIGLENKFKTQVSLMRKLINATIPNLQTIQEVAEINNDALRYTFVLPFETYAEGSRQIIESLQNLNYRIPANRIWNAWENIGRRFDKGYRGINITAISSQNQKFELQFHTAESYRLKTETHFLYAELRDKKISRERQSKIIEMLKRSAENVERPKGV